MIVAIKQLSNGQSGFRLNWPVLFVLESITNVFFARPVHNVLLYTSFET